VTCTIRPAGLEDAGTLLGLIQALADYENLPPPDDEARRRLIADGFGEKPYYQSLLLEVDGRALGYALYFFTYSTFLARPTLYLEDIFVLPQERRQGLGSELMRHLAREAIAHGCGRMEWQVLDWNRPALDFYERLGARRLSEWLPYRLTQEEIARLANTVCP
jgi:GNAT superfamily N-acetyltransferase